MVNIQVVNRVIATLKKYYESDTAIPGSLEDTVEHCMAAGRDNLAAALTMELIAGLNPNADKIIPQYPDCQCTECMKSEAIFLQHLRDGINTLEESLAATRGRMEEHIDELHVKLANTPDAKALAARQNAAYAAMHDRVARHLEAKLGSCYLTYSAYRTDHEDVVIDNLDEVPIPGKVRIVMDRDTFYGGDGSRNFRSEVLDSPTWLQLCVEAEAMIGVTMNAHHSFLEAVRPYPEDQQDEDGVTLLQFCMGS